MFRRDPRYNGAMGKRGSELPFAEVRGRGPAGSRKLRALATAVGLILCGCAALLAWPRPALGQTLLEQQQDVNWYLPQLSNEYVYGGAGVALLGLPDRLPANPAAVWESQVLVRSGMAFARGGGQLGGLHSMAGYSGRVCRSDGLHCLVMTMPSFQFSKITRGRTAKDAIQITTGLAYHFGDAVHVGASLAFGSRPSSCPGTCDETASAQWSNVFPDLGIILSSPGVLPEKVNRWLRLDLGLARPSAPWTSVWRMGYRVELVVQEGLPAKPLWQEGAGQYRRTEWNYIIGGYAERHQRSARVALVFMQDFEWASLPDGSTPITAGEGRSSMLHRGLAYGIHCDWGWPSLWLGGSYSRRYGHGAALLFDIQVIQLSFFYAQRLMGFEPLAGDEDWAMAGPGP